MENTGSVDPSFGVVKGYGLGVIVIGFGSKVIPPLIEVVPPRVLVAAEGE